MSIEEQNLIDHYKNPRNYGLLETYDFHHKLVNHSCGDEIEVTILSVDGIVEKFGYVGRGCALSLGTMSIFSEYAIGKNLEEIKKLSFNDIEELLLAFKVNPGRHKCVEMCTNVLRNPTE